MSAAAAAAAARRLYHPIKSNVGGSAVSYIERQYYGLGRKTTCNLLRSIGMSPDIKKKDVPAHQMVRINRILSQQVSPAVQKTKEADIVAKIRSGAVQGRRLAAGLPARGQRTVSNGRTCKKAMQYYLSLVRRAKEAEG
uniref:40S ribosomal protein S13 n=1 Tax=Eutreptiella gymnastica TaxID=73025 RepID=A0A6U8EAG0_9EUGL